MTLPGRQHPITSSTAASHPLAHRIPRWVWLALPDDAAQLCHLAELLHPRSHLAQEVELGYLVRELTRTNWRREIVRRTRRPSFLQPSKRARHTGYRVDSNRKRIARMKVDPKLRVEIARKGRAAQ